MYRLSDNVHNGEQLHQDGVHSHENELSPLEQNCKKTIWYFLNQPNFEVPHGNPGLYVREQLGFEKEEWLEVANELMQESGLMYHAKSTPAAPRADILGINLLKEIEDGVPPHVDEEMLRFIAEPDSRV